MIWVQNYPHSLVWLHLSHCSPFILSEISLKHSIILAVPTFCSILTSTPLTGWLSGFCSLHVTELLHNLLDPMDPLLILPGLASLQHTICHSILPGIFFSLAFQDRILPWYFSCLSTLTFSLSCWMHFFFFSFHGDILCLLPFSFLV